MRERERERERESKRVDYRDSGHLKTIGCPKETSS